MQFSASVLDSMIEAMPLAQLLEVVVAAQGIVAPVNTPPRDLQSDSSAPTARP
jgi:hypothetical protein